MFRKMSKVCVLTTLMILYVVACYCIVVNFLNYVLAKQYKLQKSCMLVLIKWKNVQVKNGT